MKKIIIPVICIVAVVAIWYFWGSCNGLDKGNDTKTKIDTGILIQPIVMYENDFIKMDVSEVLSDKGTFHYSYSNENMNKVIVSITTKNKKKTGKSLYSQGVILYRGGLITIDLSRLKNGSRYLHYSHEGNEIIIYFNADDQRLLPEESNLEDNGCCGGGQ